MQRHRNTARAVRSFIADYLIATTVVKELRNCTTFASGYSERKCNSGFIALLLEGCGARDKLLANRTLLARGRVNWKGGA